MGGVYCLNQYTPITIANQPYYFFLVVLDSVQTDISFGTGIHNKS